MPRPVAWECYDWAMHKQHGKRAAKSRSRLKEASRRRYEQVVKRVFVALAVMLLIGLLALDALFPPEGPADGNTQYDRSLRKTRFLVDVFWNFMRGVGFSDRATRIFLVSMLVISCVGVVGLFIFLRRYDPAQTPEPPDAVDSSTSGGEAN